MNRLFFDISDIVAFARKSSRVTGMQRVQSRLVALLAEQHGGDMVRCVFSRSKWGAMHECSGAGLFAEIDFCPGRFLASLGVRAAAAPYEHEVRGYLARHRGSFPRRLAARLRLAWTAAVNRPGLPALGLTLPDASAVQAVQVRRIRRIPAGDTLVLLGSTWAHPPVERLARRTRAAGGTVVSLIHDVLPVTHPQFFTDGHVRRFHRFLAASPTYTDLFLCTSEYSKCALVEILSRHGRTPPPIDVVPLAHEFFGSPRNDRSASATANTSAVVAAKPFVLCVGTIEVRKNGANLLRAWIRVLDALGSEAPLLVFAGRRGWKLAEFDAVFRSDERLKTAVGFLDGASDADLAFLYQHCLFTVFPSLAEGWGLPVGESLWFGRWCVASNRSSIPEVGGGVCDYVDPADVEGLADAMLRGIRDPHRVREREQRVASAALRTWQDVADGMSQLLARGPSEGAVTTGE
jgi:glycosyltransferase involved in cell wall biosynthesis